MAFLLYFIWNIKNNLQPELLLNRYPTSLGMRSTVFAAPAGISDVSIGLCSALVCRAMHASHIVNPITDMDMRYGAQI